jgi:hypothetical protein
MSRTSSQQTVQGTQARAPQPSPRPTSAALARLSMSPPSTARPTSLSKAQTARSHSSVGDSDSASGASSSSSSPVESRLLRRPPRFTAHKGKDGEKDRDLRSPTEEEADDEDDAPAFLPFSHAATTGPHKPSAAQRGEGSEQKSDHLSATLRGVVETRMLASGHRPQTARKQEPTIKSQTSDSSNSSTTPALRDHQTLGFPPRPTGPLSPRRTAELAGRSPAGSNGKGKGLGRDGSDGTGTPSMGSSFSDLDDASVTQSALEEALASNMQLANQNGMASRVSTISQALRSRYL